MKHKYFPQAESHTPVNWWAATIADRPTYAIEADIGKICYVESTGQVQVLLAVSPMTWRDVSRSTVATVEYVDAAFSGSVINAYETPDSYPRAVTIPPSYMVGVSANEIWRGQLNQLLSTISSDPVLFPGYQFVSDFQSSTGTLGTFIPQKGTGLFGISSPELPLTPTGIIVDDYLELGIPTGEQSTYKIDIEFETTARAGYGQNQSNGISIELMPNATVSNNWAGVGNYSTMVWAGAGGGVRSRLDYPMGLTYEPELALSAGNHTITFNINHNGRSSLSLDGQVLVVNDLSWSAPTGLTAFSIYPEGYNNDTITVKSIKLSNFDSNIPPMLPYGGINNSCAITNVTSMGFDYTLTYDPQNPPEQGFYAYATDQNNRVFYTKRWNSGELPSGPVHVNYGLSGVMSFYLMIEGGTYSGEPRMVIGANGIETFVPV